ncbi:MAG TPA: RNA polymerase sigma factor [Thermodesulfobacteriota bacterium]|nr:RNA polymerase sigma factor [Thermodesulfobacteriota bacterium]
MIDAGFKIETLTDEDVVRRVLTGEREMFEILMRRYNRRIYRAARAIVRDDGEAEDVMQCAYVSAYANLGQFDGLAKFSTWLTRIAVNEALARVRMRKRLVHVQPGEDTCGIGMNIYTSKMPDPEQNALTKELASMLEEAVDSLPEAYRSVFMLRQIEDMSTAETAECLNISEDAVKVRLFRAKALLRDELCSRIGSAAPDAFTFAGRRCDRIVATVLDRIRRM